MNVYENAKIYALRSNSTEKFYIGSTTMSLRNRFMMHKCAYKRYINGKHNKVSSFDIIKFGDAYIELLETFPCKSKLELLEREGSLIRFHILNSINKNIAGRTVKQYQQDNKDKLKMQQKEYYQNNRLLILQKYKLKYQEKKERLIALRKLEEEIER